MYIIVVRCTQINMYIAYFQSPDGSVNCIIIDLDKTLLHECPQYLHLNQQLQHTAISDKNTNTNYNDNNMIMIFIIIIFIYYSN